MTAPLRRRTACVECGSRIAQVLARLGSIRCHDCRDESSFAPA